MNPEFYAMLFTMHGTIMVFFVLSTAPVSRLRQHPDPPPGRRPRHGLPLPERPELLDLPARLPDHPDLLLRGRGRRGRGMDLLPAALRPQGLGARLPARAGPLDPGHGLLHRLLHHGRAQLRDHHPEHAHQGPLAHAHAHDDVGHVPGGDPRPPRLPRLDRGQPDAAVRPQLRHQLLPAFGPRALRPGAPDRRRPAAAPGRHARFSGSTCSGSSATPRSTS